jgi:hypothetical protein
MLGGAASVAEATLGGEDVSSSKDVLEDGVVAVLSGARGRR